MKVEMYEKVGEVEVTELRSASTNKEIAERKKTLQERIAQKEFEEHEKKKKAMEILSKIIEAINTEADAGSFSLMIDWAVGEKNSICRSWEEWHEYFKYFWPILDSAGYKLAADHEYSDSWYSKSGKIGFVTIAWR